MAKAASHSTSESECDAPDRLTENDAIARCVRAWRVTMKTECAKLDEDDCKYDAEQAAKCSYLSRHAASFPATRTFATSSPA